MTTGKEYQLADKLQKQIRERGRDVSGMQASSTSELLRRARMGQDPSVNCAEQAFRESYRSRQGAAPRPASGEARARTTRESADADSYRRRANAAYASDSRFADHAAGRQSAAGKSTSSAYAKTAEQRTYAKAAAEQPAGDAGEIRVRQKAFPPMFIAMLLLGTVMVMFLVFSISEVYQTTNEIARLENELEALQSEAEELRLRLEEKNDVRKIEEIATTELGMVKEDSLQRRYVSLSDGEYIELVAQETEESAGGVMLSSIFSSLERFFERFK
ncbi:MAG: cell division protein FtsL [Clostridia bacterium]|nr:cell division protein FtsL [Clostridia bacterium]